MLQLARPYGRLLGRSLRDLAPIVLAVGVFQLAVLRQSFPDLTDVLVGLVAVIKAGKRKAVPVPLTKKGLDLLQEEEADQRQDRRRRP